jgi:radical SAM superfamily enzyme YgiQ (UPF0313 family)
VEVLLVDLPASFRSPYGGWCLGYRYLVSSLRAQGFSAGILHPPLRFDGSAREALLAQIVSTQADIVGFTTYDVALDQLLSFLRDLRAAGCRGHVTLGGFCASSIPSRLLEAAPEADSVVVGEGEISLVELARHLLRGRGKVPIPGVWLRRNGAVVAGGSRPLLEDLDSLPPPALDGLDVGRPPHAEIGFPPAIGSRGCYGRCAFCSIQSVYRSCPGEAWRPFSASRAVDQVEALSAATGQRSVTFVDENFMGPGAAGRQHARELAGELRRRALGVSFNFGCRASDVHEGTFALLQEAGLAAVSLGIESMSEEALRQFNKGTTPAVNHRALRQLERLQLPVEITFIFFHPLSTLEEIRQNLSFVDYVRESPYLYFNNSQPFSEFVPFFGTEMTRRLEELGLVKRSLPDFTVIYADPRVEFIARQVSAVPCEYLSRLRALLPAQGDGRLEEVRSALLAHEAYLTMERIPEVVSRLCGLFERGFGPSDEKVLSAAAELESESERISRFVERLVELAA